jgi:hypothetical protein
MASLSILILSACGSAANATPTVSIDAIFTAAYQTFSAQEATQLALTPPTETPLPTLPPTLALPSPLATISFSSPTANTGGSACDNSSYVADVTIPDNTTIAAGANFTKTWKLLNSGSCAWSTSYKLSYSSGEKMGGSDTLITVPVPRGNQTDVSVKLVAPTASGTYTGTWRMQNAGGQPFGNFVTVVIKVGSGGATNTPGPSPTAGPSATAGPSPTGGSGTFTISGNVAHLGGVLVTYTGGTLLTASNGDYEFTVPAGWSGSVTPSDGVHTFIPASRSYSNVQEDWTDAQNYTLGP